MGHALMENRHGLLVDFQLTQATGTAERDAVPELIEQARERGFHPQTLGADKGYDTKACVADLRERKVTPHVSQNTSGRRSAIDGRTTRHAGYAISQRIRKRVEEIFGWMKTVGGFRRTRYRRPGPDPDGRLPGRHRLQPGPDGALGSCRRASIDRQTRLGPPDAAPYPPSSTLSFHRFDLIRLPVPVADSAQALLPRPARRRAQRERCVG